MEDCECTLFSNPNRSVMTNSTQQQNTGFDYISENLIVSDYPTACNVDLLEALCVSHVVSCGFDQPPTAVGRSDYGKRIKYFFLPDVDDIPSANILQYLPKAVSFIQNALENEEGKSFSCKKQNESMIKMKYTSSISVVLIHCAFGQSRSCAVCVGYLMTSQVKSWKEDNDNGHFHLILQQCYDFVANARKCIAINPGFMRQLEIYRRMQTKQAEIFLSNGEFKGPFSSAHAYYRSARLDAEIKSGKELSSFFPSPQNLRSSGFQIKEKIFRCRKCRIELFTSSNIIDALTEEDILHLPVISCNAKGKGFLAGSLFATTKSKHDPYLSFGRNKTKLQIEPIDWMHSFITTSPFEGKVFCPKCDQKIGSYECMKSSFYFVVEIINSKED